MTVLTFRDVSKFASVNPAIISYDNFIAIDPMKKFGARFSFSDFHGQKSTRQQEPGLREKITENMINI